MRVLSLSDVNVMLYDKIRKKKMLKIQNKNMHTDSQKIVPSQTMLK